MTDTKIQRLRGIAAWLEVAEWTNMATNVREAADELERLGKLEAAVKSFCSSTNAGDSCEAFDLMKQLVEG